MADQGVTQEIKRRLDLAQVIAEYIPIKKAGSSIKACCPFHNEKSPSFFISTEKQMWHCFGCGEGGDVFAFVMKMEGMEFKDALRHLAKKAGVELTEQSRKDSSERSGLVEANTMAMKFYHQVLMKTPDAKAAREYLAKRKMTEDTIVAFGIGYAPDSWDSLRLALAKKGVSDTTLLRAGLASAREKGDGCFDRFRGRIMFPIRDVHGDVVGFTARVMPGPDGKDPKDTGKYVNTPLTPLYNKSAVLFALDRAKHEIKRQGFAVVVEGNMDAIASHQAGVANVVASSGTAFTDEQLTLLKRFTTKLVLSFDADAAGQLAAQRSIDLALAHGFTVRMLRLPPEAGKDPDDCIRKSPEMWKKAITDAVPFMQWYIDRVRPQIPAADPQKKGELAKELLREIAKIAESVEQAEWVKVLSALFRTPEAMLLEQLQMLRAQTRSIPFPTSRPRSGAVPLAVRPPSGGRTDARPPQFAARDANASRRFGEHRAGADRESPLEHSQSGSPDPNVFDQFQSESSPAGSNPIPSRPQPPKRQPDRRKNISLTLIGMALRWPELQAGLKAIPETAFSPETLPLYKAALGAYPQNDSADSASPDSAPQQEITSCMLRAEKDFGDIHIDERSRTFSQLGTELAKVFRETRKRQLVQLMAHAEKTRDTATILAIQQELATLLTRTID